MINLFFSYAHEDEALRNELEIHLSMLKRSGLIRTWHDRRIVAGQDLNREISEQLEAADVILLLLSPYFLASDYCYETEAQRAIQRHREGAAVAIPVIVQPCDWLASPFRELRATPKDGKPVSKFPNIHDAFLEITQDIRGAAESLGKSGGSVLPQPVEAPTFAAGVRSSNLRVKKTFSDRDRDAFIDDAYSYIEKFFENSLDELQERNPVIEHRFKKLSATAFTAAVYRDGSKRTSCQIRMSGRALFGSDIVYSASDSAATNSMNDGIRVEDDGYQLGFKTSGLGMFRQETDGLMTAQGAAEHFWSQFIAPLQ